MNVNEVYEFVRPFTMTTEDRLVAFLNIINYAPPGPIVECGVWKGGSMMAAALWLAEIDDIRELYLYDTFSGMTPPTAEDVDLLGNHANTYFDFAASLGEVSKNMSATGYPHHKIHMVVGDVLQTIPEFAPPEIAVLRLDTDWYASTLYELVHLWPRLVRGGTLIVDDYGHWQGAKQAVDEYFQDTVKIISIDYTAVMVNKCM